MRSELKIGIVVGIVIVVGLIVFFVNNGDEDERKQNEPLNQPSQDNRTTQQPPAPIEPTPMTPSETSPPPVDPIEVVVKENDESNTPPQPGEEVIPAVKETSKPVEPVVVNPPPEPKKPRYHVVKSGENLYSISEMYFGQGNQTKGIKAIIKANSELIKNPDSIHPDWRLKIPYPEDIAP